MLLGPGCPIRRSPDQRLLATSPERIAGTPRPSSPSRAKASTICPSTYPHTNGVVRVTALFVAIIPSLRSGLLNTERSEVRYYCSLFKGLTVPSPRPIPLLAGTGGEWQRKGRSRERLPPTHAPTERSAGSPLGSRRLQDFYAGHHVTCILSRAEHAVKRPSPSPYPQATPA